MHDDCSIDRRKRLSKADAVLAIKKEQQQPTSGLDYGVTLKELSVSSDTLAGYVSSIAEMSSIYNRLRGSPPSAKVTRYTEDDFLRFTRYSDENKVRGGSTLKHYLDAVVFHQRAYRWGLLVRDPIWAELGSRRLRKALDALEYQGRQGPAKTIRGSLSGAMVEQFVRYIRQPRNARYRRLSHFARTVHYAGIRKEEANQVECGDYVANDDGTFQMILRVNKKATPGAPAQTMIHRKPVSAFAIKCLQEASAGFARGEKIFTRATAPNDLMLEALKVAAYDLKWPRGLAFDIHSERHGYVEEARASIQTVVTKVLTAVFTQHSVGVSDGYRKSNQQRQDAQAAAAARYALLPI